LLTNGQEKTLVKQSPNSQIHKTAIRRRHTAS
jgi:hypothetical protein